MTCSYSSISISDTRTTCDGSRAVRHPSRMVSDPLQRVLRGSREELNARFAEARQRFPALSPEPFTEFLRDVVDPLACAVANASPERCDAAVLAAYDIALDLVGQRLVGSGSRGMAIDGTWRRLLPA